MANCDEIEPTDLVSKLCFHQVKDIATKEWWALMDRQNKLCQISIMDMRSAEERVVESFKMHPEKVPTLVNEVICLSIWKREVLPILVAATDTEMASKFPMLYIMLYHESTVIALLEILLYHSDLCKALEDSAVDLVDYCAAHITHLISMSQNSESKMCPDDIMLQKEDIDFGIAMRCLTIVMYLAENIERLNLSVTARIFSTHDFPLLICNLVEQQPWIKEEDGRRFQFIDGSWHRKSDGSLAGRHEANAWLAIHQLLLHPELGKHYHVTEYAKGQFMRLENKIDESLLGQIPPLQQLKQGLVYLSNFQLPEQKPPVILELIPEMTNALAREGEKGWSKIAQLHSKRLLENTDISKIAESFSQSLQISETPTNLCTNCTQPAKSRCSKCKTAWYCERSCQLQHFPHHKIECVPFEAGKTEK